MTKKIAVILLNLGGPDKLSSVKHFLFNLFNDPAIIRLYNPFRWLLAKLIASRREEKAKGIYSQMGGGSPIFDLTLRQAKALEDVLSNKKKDQEFKILVSMRYWHPFASEVIEKLRKFSPDEILLLPLYPQFSTTTTQSSLKEFASLLKKSDLKNVNLKSVCCYYQDPDFIKAQANLIKDKIDKFKDKFRILFSAHGLPEYIIKQGDPYQFQIEETSKKIVKELAINKLDYVVCYQSKVGPLKWLGPSTEEELLKAAKENIAVVVVPIAFVSEHSETLVELDIEYKELFEQNCKKAYIRVPALNEEESFIQCLANQVELMLNGTPKVSKDNLKLFTKSVCADNFVNCICNNKGI